MIATLADVVAELREHRGQFERIEAKLAARIRFDAGNDLDSAGPTTEQESARITLLRDAAVCTSWVPGSGAQS